MNTIDWAAFGLVAIVSVVGACAVVAIYSLGLRLWSGADAMTGKYSIAEDGTIVPRSQGIPIARSSAGAVGAVRAAAVACFAVSGAIVLYGIYLIVPQFH